jgi:predicted secreted protein
MKRSSIATALFLAALALWPEQAAAQFWSPWFSRGYRPPTQERKFETLRPFGEGITKGKKKTDDAAKTEAPPPEARPVPYDGELSRLSELLGALHYLQPLCGEKDKERWRNEMQSLLDTEQPSPERELQPRLSVVRADLPELYAVGEPCDRPFPRRRREARARDRDALRQLIAFDRPR